MPETYGYDVAEDQAIATVKQFARSGMNLIDKSNEYGAGESERRIGIALAESAPLRPGPRRRDESRP